MTKPDGGPAFPSPNHSAQGLSIRDWFAGQVLANIWGDGWQSTVGYIPGLAEYAYQVADAMLKERELGP